MKNLNFFRLFAIVLISIFTLSISASAAETPKKEVKIKTSFVAKDSKHKLETITNLLKGVTECDFCNDKKELTVKYNPDEINSDMIVYAINILGYDAEIIQDKDIDKITSDKKPKEVSKE